MWAIYTVIVYFALALLLPVGWVLVPVWRRARAERQVACPDAGATALVALDPWYAARGRAIGAEERRVRSCSRWPEHAGCGRECLEQIHGTI